MKTSSILGILGIVFGLLGGLAALFLSAFVPAVATNAGIAIMASLLGIIAIWLTEQDSKIAAVEYIIAGLGLLIGVSMFGVLGFILFIIAAILVFKDKKVAVPTKEVI